MKQDTPERAMTRSASEPQAPTPPRCFPVRGTVLAFDYGLRRVGVAVGEIETRHAHPLVVIRVEGAARFAQIDRLVGEWKPRALVVGVPNQRCRGNVRWPRWAWAHRQIQYCFGSC